MKNPWEGTAKDKNGEYIANCDKENGKIYDLKQKYKGDYDYELKLGAMPSPYTGHPEKALVFFLVLNPGYHDGDEKVAEDNEDVLLKNLTHSNLEYPFVSFHPDLKGTEGDKWWSEKLKFLIKALGEKGKDILSQYAFSAEYFPYPSRNCKVGNKVLDSQEYTFYLVRKAMKDNKIIVIMRSKALWFDAVNGLESYHNLITVKNPQNPYISTASCAPRLRGNMSEEDFKKIVDALKKTGKKP